MSRTDTASSERDRPSGTSRRSVLTGLFGSYLVGFGLASGRSAAESLLATDSTVTDDSRLPDPGMLEAFVDGLMADRINAETPGATVAVVEGQDVVLAKGYGYADAETEAPVQVDETAFRIGSVSKVVTFTAVMQGVEQGTLDLDADVNTYLADSAVEIPEINDEPVTLRHLGTHTSGFEAIPNPGIVSQVDELTSLETALVNDRPERIRPPDEDVAYSNYGTTLAGHIVAEAHDMTFEEYVESEIFEPLGMDNSTFAQPVSDDLPGELASPHVPADDGFAVPDPVYINWRPAGSMSTTATDMAAFMSAHLGEGAVGDARILEPETARTMHSTHFDRHPAVNGWAYGFWEEGRPEDDILGHGGATIHYLADHVISLDHNVGIFVGYNSRAGGGGAPREVVKEIVDKYDLGFEAYSPESPTDPDTVERTDRVAGEYGPTVEYESALGEMVLRMEHQTVKVTDNGELVLIDVTGEELARFVETDPYVFKEADGHDVLAFDVENGDVVRAHLSSAPTASLTPVPFHERTLVTAGTTGVALGGFLLSVLGWGGLGGWRWWQRRSDGTTATGQESPSSPDRESSESDLEGSE